MTEIGIFVAVGVSVIVGVGIVATGGGVAVGLQFGCVLHPQRNQPLAQFRPGSMLETAGLVVIGGRVFGTAVTDGINCKVKDILPE